MYINKYITIILMNLVIATISFILNIAGNLSKIKQTVTTWKLIEIAIITTRIILKTK